MDWINLAQDRNKWQASLNKVMNLGVSIKGEEKLRNSYLSQERLCFMDLFVCKIQRVS
jgi:hypothetical protein